MAEFLDVDPATLRLPSSRQHGADPAKLARQISQFGASAAGMPPLEVVRAANGELVIMNGVTRATRVAKLLPGVTIRVEVTNDCPNWDVRAYSLIKDKLP